MSVLQTSDNTFKNEVLESSTLTLVDFWATWCGPCKMIAPILDELQTDMGSQVQIAKLDVDHNPQTAAQFGVRSIPTLILFKDGKPISTKVGFNSKTALQGWIQENL
jgi:thioredoxin 1